MGWSSPAKSLNPKDPADKEQKPKQGSSPRRSDPGWKKEILPRLHEDFTNSKSTASQSTPSSREEALVLAVHTAGRQKLTVLTPLLLIRPQPTHHQALHRAEHRAFWGWADGGFSPSMNPTL